MVGTTAEQGLGKVKKKPLGSKEQGIYTGKSASKRKKKPPGKPRTRVHQLVNLGPGPPTGPALRLDATRVGPRSGPF